MKQKKEGERLSQENRLEKRQTSVRAHPGGGRGLPGEMTGPAWDALFEYQAEF